MADLRNKFSKAVKGAWARTQLEGTLGLPLGSDEYEQGPDDNNPYIQWVVVEQEGGSTLMSVYNDAVPYHPGIRVIIEQDKDGAWYVSGPDKQRAIIQMGSLGQNVGVSPHVHSIGSGLDDPVESLRFLPGACWYVGDGNGFEFLIDEFWYSYEGVPVYFASTIIDISAHQPASGEQAWVKIYVDPSTNLPGSTVGTAYSEATVLSKASLADIQTGMIELLGVKIYGNDTDVGDYERYEDIRYHLNFDEFNRTTIDYILTDSNGDVLSDSDGNVLLESI